MQAEVWETPACLKIQLQDAFEKLLSPRGRFQTTPIARSNVSVVEVDVQVPPSLNLADLTLDQTLHTGKKFGLQCGGARKPLNLGYTRQERSDVHIYTYIYIYYIYVYI